MVWLGPLILDLAPVPIWKRTCHSKPLLTFISVYYLAVEIGILACYLSYNGSIDF